MSEKYNYWVEKISSLKKQNLLTDAVKLYLTGMLAEDKNITRQEAERLRELIGFDWDKYAAVQEAALFGDVVDYKDQKVNFTASELMKK